MERERKQRVGILLFDLFLTNSLQGKHTLPEEGQKREAGTGEDRQKDRRRKQRDDRRRRKHETRTDRSETNASKKTPRDD